MAIKLVWDDEAKTTIRYDIPSKWTWNDLFTAREEVFKWMDDSPRDEIFTIANFVDGKVTIPNDVMKHFGKATSYSHPKAGLMVIVGAGMFMRTAFSGFRRVFVTTTGRPLDFAYADNLAHARRILRDSQSG